MKLRDAWAMLFRSFFQSNRRECTAEKLNASIEWIPSQFTRCFPMSIVVAEASAVHRRSFGEYASWCLQLTLNNTREYIADVKSPSWTEPSALSYLLYTILHVLKMIHKNNSSSHLLVIIPYVSMLESIWKQWSPEFRSAKAECDFHVPRLAEGSVPLGLSSSMMYSRL